MRAVECPEMLGCGQRNAVAPRSRPPGSRRVSCCLRGPARHAAHFVLSTFRLPFANCTFIAPQSFNGALKADEKMQCIVLFLGPSRALL